MRRSPPLFVMGILWVVLIAGLGLGFFLNRQDQVRRRRLGQNLVSRYNSGVVLAHRHTHTAASVACERAARGNPGSPSVWSVWALVQAQGVLLLGDDPAEWNRIHRVASQLLGRDWSGADAGTRIRLLASRILVRTVTAETQSELTENFYEALRSWDFWPHSTLLRNAALWAAVAAGQTAFVRGQLPGPEQPLDWPLLLDWHLSREEYEAAGGILDRWTRQEPDHPSTPLWRAWIACRLGQGNPAAWSAMTQDPAGVSDPPALRAWRQLVRACAAAGELARAVAELEKVPLLAQDAVLLSVMRLALQFGAQDLYAQAKKEFLQRRGGADERLEPLEALERMNQLEPEAAYAWFSRQEATNRDELAVWSALLAGRPVVARRWAARMKTPFGWPEAAFSDDLSEADLNEFDRRSKEKTHSLWWTALWARAAVASLDQLEWGTLAHETRLEAIRARLSQLPATSRFTARLAARVHFELDRFSEAGMALARLCGDEGARFEDDLGPCRSLRGPTADVELFARFLTCEEGRSVDYPLVRGRLDQLLPLLARGDRSDTDGPAVAQRPADNALFWQLRLLRLTLRAQPGQSRLVEEKLKTLPSLPQNADPETLTEAALIHLYLGKTEAARALLARSPGLPVRFTRRLAHHALMLQDPAFALRQLEPVLTRDDLAPRVRQTLRVLHAQARLQMKQDVCDEFEELFRLDPCPEMALTTARAYLARGRKADCPRLRALTSASGEKSPELTRVFTEINRFCAEPAR